MLLATLLSLLKDEMRVRWGSTSVQCMSNKTTKKKILFVQPGAEERSSLSCMYNYQGSDVIHTSCI